MGWNDGGRIIALQPPRRHLRRATAFEAGDGEDPFSHRHDSPFGVNPRNNNKAQSEFTNTSFAETETNKTKQKNMNMNQTDGWMSGWMGGGMWIWTVIGVLVVVLLVVVINKLSKK